MLDIGCCDGDFLRQALNSHLFSTVCGVDIDARALEKAKNKMYPSLFDEREYKYFRDIAMDKEIADRIKNTETSLFKIDMCADQLYITDPLTSDSEPPQLVIGEKQTIQPTPVDEGKFVVTLIEVIERIHKDRLDGLLENLHKLTPDVIVLTTQNRDFKKFFNLERDHEFEFDAKEFVAFCDSVALDVYNYTLISIPYPEIDKLFKQCKQSRAAMKDFDATFMAVFTLKTRNQQLYRVNGRIEIPFI